MSVELLVTGGGGMLASSLRSLRPDGIYVTRQNCDLRDRRDVDALFARFRPKRVIHLAARIGGVKFNAEHNAELFAENAQINANVLNAAQCAGVSRLVGVLSSCAFPFFDDRPTRESDLHSGMPFEGNLGYGYAKRMLDVHARIINAQCDVRFSTIAPVTMYGPHDDFDPETGHVVAALIAKALRAKALKTPLEVWGTGQAIRQFVYAPDVARLLLNVLEEPLSPEPIIVAPDDGMTVCDVAHAVALTVGFDGEIRFDTSKPEGVRKKILKSARFANEFSTFKFTSFAAGLRETVEWLQSRLNAAGVRPVKEMVSDGA